MPYHSPRTISRLLAQQGDIEADAALRSGAINARAITDIGRTVAGTLGDVMRAQDFEHQREAAAAQAGKQHAIDSVLRKAVDPVTGAPDAAMAAREIQQIDPQQALQWWNRASEQEKAQLAKEKDLSNQVSQAAGAILSADPARRPELYAQARASMIQKGMLKPDQAPEAYDEGWLVQTHRSALTVAQQIEATEKAVDQHLQTERDKKTGEHQTAMENRVTFGQPEKALINGKPGFFRAGSDGKAYGLDGAQLDPSKIQQMPEKEAQPRAAAREPSITPAQRAAAERWKQGELSKLEDAFTDSNQLVSDPITGQPMKAPNAMTPQQLDVAKKRIQASYLEQLGVAPAPPAPAQAPPAPPPAAPPTMPNIAPVASHQQGPQIGDVKKFPNGRQGKWDGRGWVAVS